mmetsp:Transcript_28631/g.66486  ORF Transcript_28631/g.66486 Transcript_28631/m.66486 type:complete len:239 (-) Transcript_28631:194-910(-)
MVVVDLRRLDPVGGVRRDGSHVTVACVEIVGLELLLGVRVVRLVEAVDAISVERPTNDRAVRRQGVVVVAREVVVVVVRHRVATASIEHEGVLHLGNIPARNLERILACGHIGARVADALHARIVRARLGVVTDAKPGLLRAVDVHTVHRKANATAERGAIRAVLVERRRKLLLRALGRVLVAGGARRVAEGAVAVVVVGAKVGGDRAAEFASRLVVGELNVVVVIGTVKRAPFAVRD